MDGIHRVPYRGIPATGKGATYEACRFLRIVDGKIADMWSMGDSLGVFTQLGVKASLQGATGEGTWRITRSRHG
jgi:hypothetical protein